MDIEKISKEITDLSVSDKFSGCVLLNDRERNVIYSFYCGYASKEYDVKNTFHTK